MNGVTHSRGLGVLFVPHQQVYSAKNCVLILTQRVAAKKFGDILSSGLKLQFLSEDDKRHDYR